MLENESMESWRLRNSLCTKTGMTGRTLPDEPVLDLTPLEERTPPEVEPVLLKYEPLLMVMPTFLVTVSIAER